MSQLYYNMALLSSLHEPIKDSLSVLDHQLEKFLTKQIDNSQVTGHQEIHQVVGSLTMVECRALTKICSTIELAAKGICFADRRGWNAETLINVSNITRKLIKEVKEHLSLMVSGEPELAVKMWGNWSSLKIAIGELVEDVYSLYEPYPIFDNNEFSPLSLEDLKEMGDGARSVFKNSVMELDRISKSNSLGRVDEVELTFKKVYSAVDRIYSARHRRGYQAYWMCLKARLIKALDEGGESIISEINQWKDILIDASVQAKRFSEDSRRVNPDSMILVVRPFLKRQPGNIRKTNGFFEEVEKVLNLKSFWYWSEVVQNEEKKEAFEDRKKKEDELREAFENMHLSWSKFSVDQTGDVRPFLKSISEILKKNGAIENKNAIALFKAVGSCAQKIHSDNALAYDDSFMEECATTLLVIEEELNKKNKNEEFFNKQIEIQAKRIQALFLKEDLSKLPRVKIDDYSKKKLVEAAFRNVVKKSVTDLEEVEKILKDFLFERETSDVSLMANAEDLCRIAEKVLSVVGIKEAGGLLIYLSDLVCELSTRNEKNPKLDKAQKATVILSSVVMFLKGIENNDEVAFKHLKSGLDLIGESYSSRELEEKNLDKIYRKQEQISLDDSFENQRNDKIELPVSQSNKNEVGFVCAEENLLKVQEAIIVEDDNYNNNSDIQPIQDANDYSVGCQENNGQPTKEGLSAVLLELDEAGQESEASSLGGRGTNKKVLPLLMSEEGLVDKPELLEVFNDAIVESIGLLNQIDEIREVLKNDRENQDEIASLRRAYHTLKGSFRLSGLRGMGELCFLVEERLNTALRTEEPYSVKLDELIEFSKEKLFLLINQLMMDGEALVVGKDIKRMVENSYSKGFDLIYDDASQEESEEFCYTSDLDFNFEKEQNNVIEMLKNSALENDLNSIKTNINTNTNTDLDEEEGLKSDTVTANTEKFIGFEKQELAENAHYQEKECFPLVKDAKLETTEEHLELVEKEKTPWNYMGIDEELADVLLKEIKTLRNNVWQAIESDREFESVKTKEICSMACHTIVALSKDFGWDRISKLCKILEEKLNLLIEENKEISDEAISVLDFSFKEVLARLNVIIETSKDPDNDSVAFDSVSSLDGWFKKDFTFNEVEEKFQEAEPITNSATETVSSSKAVGREVVDEEDEQWQQVFIAIEGISNNMQMLAGALSVLSEKRMQRNRDD